MIARWALLGLVSGCKSVYQVNLEIHACQRRDGHRGRHRARFTITSETDSGRPIHSSEVEIQWSSWEPVRP